MRGRQIGQKRKQIKIMTGKGGWEEEDEKEGENRRVKGESGEELLTCCRACWVRLSSSDHSLCQLGGTSQGCSSRPTSGTFSCRDERRMAEEAGGSQRKSITQNKG